MGRSWPNFAHDECTFGVTRSTGQEKRALMLQGLFIDSLNVKESSHIDLYLEQQKKRVLSCWTCKTCDFLLKSADPNSSEQYHFLDYSGTHEAAQDLEVFRKAVNIDKLSLLAVSYGTQIFATYATVFPESVDKIVLDSGMSPMPDFLSTAKDYARSINIRLEYLAFSCDTKNMRTPGSCPVPNMANCFQKVTSFLTQQLSSGALLPYENALANHLLFMTHDTDKNWSFLSQLCSAGEKQDLNMLRNATNLYGNSLNQDENKDVSVCESCPTSPSNVYGNEDYSVIMGNSIVPTANVPETLTLGQSLAGGCLSKDSFKQQVEIIDLLYPGLGTHLPARQFLYVYAMGYYWPEPHPTAPAGDVTIKGIVSGQLYDSSTPYSWTQEIKQAFPSMTLLTSQWIEHGLNQHDSSTPEINPNNNSCLNHIENYLLTGEIDISDGTVCRSGFHKLNIQQQ